MLQPLDQGIIKAVKTIYRKRLLQSVLAKMDKEEDVKNVSKYVSVLDAVHWIDTAIREVRSSTVKKCFQKCGIGHVDKSSTSDDEDEDDDEDNVVLNDLVSRVQGHNDLLFQSFDDFVACDNDLETCDNTTTNLENQVLEEYLEMQNKIPSESDNEEKLPEENEASSSMDKCSKFSLTSERETLKCVEDIKSFLLERDAVHLLTLCMKLKKDCVKCQRVH